MSAFSIVVCVVIWFLNANKYADIVSESCVVCVIPVVTDVVMGCTGVAGVTPPPHQPPPHQPHHQETDTLGVGAKIVNVEKLSVVNEHMPFDTLQSAI